MKRTKGIRKNSSSSTGAVTCVVVGDSIVTPRLAETVEYVLQVLTNSVHRGEDIVLDIFGQDFEPHERRAYNETVQFR